MNEWSVIFPRLRKSTEHDNMVWTEAQRDLGARVWFCSIFLYITPSSPVQLHPWKLLRRETASVRKTRSWAAPPRLFPASGRKDLVRTEPASARGPRRLRGSVTWDERAVRAKPGDIPVRRGPTSAGPDSGLRAPLSRPHSPPARP